MRWNPQWIWTDILAVHAALLHSGEILFFTGNEFWEMQHENNLFDHVRLFNCQTLAITKVNIPSDISDLFCCGHALTGNGNLLMAGGTKEMHGQAGVIHWHHWAGERKTWLFDMAAKQFIKCAPLNTNPDNPNSPPPLDKERSGGRWYPTLITLGSGQVLAIGGHPDIGDERHSAWFPEYFEWNKWNYTQGGRDPDVNLQDIENPLEYPRLHLLPDGRIFSSTPFHNNRVMYYEFNKDWFSYPDPTPAHDDWRKKWIADNDGDAFYQAYNKFNGTSVLLPLIPEENYKARIMVHGNTNSYLIDLSVVNPAWEPVGNRPMSKRRLTVNSVILPTGEIFFSGGVEGEFNQQRTAIGYQDSTQVNEAEIYNPFTGQWSLTPAARVVRNYHSVALLMPDGRVWTAGSSKNHYDNNQNDNRELRIEIFEPWYYGLTTRPIIYDVITEYGDVTSGLRGEFTVITDGTNEIKRVAIIRNGSVTHGFNSDQRYVGLPFTTQDYQGALKALRVSIPYNPNLVVPGHYMLFLIDKNGVPSEGKFINVKLGWSDWFEGRGDRCSSAPAVTSFAKNRLDVFVRRGFHGEIWHKSGSGTNWTDWENLGGPVQSEPAAISRGYNRLDVFARGMRDELAHKWWDGNQWSDWADLGGEIDSAPCAASWGPNRIDVFAKGKRNELAHKWWNGNEWSHWADLGGEIASAPCAISRSVNSIDVFARGLSGELAHKWWDGNQWSDWANLGGPISDAPAVASWGLNRIDVFAKGKHNELTHKWWNGNEWSDWANLGGLLYFHPAAVSWGINRIDVMCISTGGNLLHKYW